MTTAASEFIPPPVEIAEIAPGRFELSTRLVLPLPPGEIFPFFADAANLESITPAWMRFRIVTPRPIDLRRGAIIDYRLRLRGLPLRWRTEITAWNPPHEFTDTQVRGPYREWVHTHTFEPHPSGTLTADRVVYRLPAPRPIARLVNRATVAPDLRRIFHYRAIRLAQRFGVAGRPTATRGGLPDKEPRCDSPGPY